jgi:monoamine oxidase
MTDNIKIKAHSGTTYQASRVICTVSLGYLKENYSTMFKPKLPEEKIEAIEKLGFGCVNKFWLVFEQPLTEFEFNGLQIFYRNDVNFSLDKSAKKWNLIVIEIENLKKII